MADTVTLIPGDGIGPEVAQATVRLLEAAGAEIVWEEKEAKPIVGLRQEDAVADRVENAIHRAHQEGRCLTRDVGGSASTGEFTLAVIDALE